MNPCYNDQLGFPKKIDGLGKYVVTRGKNGAPSLSGECNLWSVKQGYSVF